MNSPKGTKSFLYFDPRTRTLDKLPSLLSKTTGASICEYEGRYIYVFGNETIDNELHCPWTHS